MVADSITKEEAAKMIKNLEEISNGNTEMHTAMFAQVVRAMFDSAERMDFDSVDLSDEEFERIFDQWLVSEEVNSSL